MIKDLTVEQVIDILDAWTLEEKVRVIREVLGNSTAGWERAKHPVTGRPGFRGVIRQGRKVIWRDEHVSLWVSPERSYASASQELDRRAFDAWKAEKGIR